MDSRLSFFLIAAFVFFGFAIQPEGATDALVEPNAERRESVVLGFWIFKVMLLINAIVFFVATHTSLWRRRAVLVTHQFACPEQSIPGLLWLFLAVVLIASVFLRLYCLDSGLWYDEIHTLIRYARRPFSEIITTFDSQNQHVLYSLAARMTVANLGDSAWSLRLPAAVFGVGSLAATFWFGLQVASTREAVFSTTLLAFSYHHVWFSQNARGYSGLLLCTLVASTLWLQLLRGNSKRPVYTMLGYAITISLGIYTHATGAFILFAHASIWLVLAWQRRSDWSAPEIWRPALAIVLAFTLTLQLYAIVLPQLFDTLLNTDAAQVEYKWQNPVWMMGEMIRGLARGIPGGYISISVGSVLFFLGLASYLCRRPIVTVMMTLPALLLIVTLVVLHHNLWPRMFFFSAGFGALILIRGIEVAFSGLDFRWRRSAVTTVGVLLIFLSAWTVPRAWGVKQDYLGAKDAVARLSKPGDAVVTLDMTTMPFREYLELDWVDVNSLAALRQVEKNHCSIYVLYAFPTRLALVNPDIWDQLGDYYQIVEKLSGSVNGGDIVIKRRDPSLDHC